MLFFDDYKFERFSVNEGLSQNTVYSIIQDNKGFIWICTQQGLNRFDGYNFVIYKNDPSAKNSLPHNYAGTSYKGSDGKIWFASLNGIFANYDEDKNCFNNFQLPLTESQSNTKNFITSMYEKSPGKIFIASYGTGLSIYDKIDNNYFQIDIGSFKSNYNLKNIKCLFQDEQEILWVGSWDNGLLRIDFKKKTATQYLHNPSDEKSISNNRIRFIFQDSRKIMWIGTADGLNKYIPDERIFCKYLYSTGNNKRNNLTCMAEDKNNNLWIGAGSSGLIKFDTVNNNFSIINAQHLNPHGLSSNAIMSLYSDSSNVLWIGTYNDGLLKLDCERKKFFSLNNLVDSNKYLTKLCITAFLKDCYGNILFGTDFAGLFKIDSKCNLLENFELKDNPVNYLKDQTILSLMEGQNNEIWVGTLIYGLYKFDSKLNSFENYLFSNSNSENKVHSICKYNKESEDYMWIGTLGEGLLRFDKKNKEFCDHISLKNFNNSLSSKDIKCLLLDKSGILWIGTDLGGLNSLDYDKGLITNFLFNKDDPFTMSDDFVISLCEDNKKNIWIGTMNEGLNKLDKERQTFKRYNTDQGLPGNTINGILEDNNSNLWISTNNGISKFDPEKETFRNYDIEDGLQSKEFNDGAYYKDKDGVMYFGGVNGFNFFNPDEIKDNPYIPNIVITDFQIFNHPIINSPSNLFLKKNITQTKEIIISYRESVFSFEFAALVYNNSQKNQYAYMMEGFDKEWIHCGNRRFVTYTNLEPGEYLFRVKGSNNDGIWNEEGTSIKIKITPPFWKTWWFKSLGLMSFFGAAGIAYQQKLSKVEKEKKSQEEFSRKLLDSQEAERKRISKELHDTIAHDILITKNKAVMGLKKTHDSDAVKDILNEISDLASSTLNDVRTISYDLHPHQIERLGMTKAVKSILNNASKSTGIEFSVTIQNIDKVLTKELELNVFRIIQESITNIIKHSNATEASLGIMKDNETLLITIWDNGIGISKERKDGLGLAGINERVKLYNGDLVIDSAQSNSAESKGTLIAITLPILKLEE